MNTDVAAARWPRRGQADRIASRRGEIVPAVETRGRAKPPRGLVFIPVCDERQLVDKPTLDAACPLPKETAFKKCACKIEAT